MRRFSAAFAKRTVAAFVDFVRDHAFESGEVSPHSRTWRLYPIHPFGFAANELEALAGERGAIGGPEERQLRHVSG
jgi:hypothetical protein